MIPISRGTARMLARAIEADWPMSSPALQQLRAGLEASLASRSSPRRKAKPKAQRDRTADIYEQVQERAGGRCECCGLPFDSFVMRPELDHARGRKNAPETVENTWLLANGCHWAKHNGPALRWLEKYLAHSKRHGHAIEASWAEDRIRYEEARAEFRASESARRAGGR